MNDRGRGILAEPDPTPDQIREAWHQAAPMAMLAHRDADVPVTIWDWENGQVVQVSASELLENPSDQEQAPAKSDPIDPDPARKSA